MSVRLETSVSRFVYECAGCGGSVEKTPCHTEKGKDGERQDYCGLHGWKCNNCGDGVKVKRQMRSV